MTIVPSSFCRAAFVSSGATRPIRVIPHGLGEAFRPYEDVHPPARFTIFNTFGAFAPPERKGFRELLECFATAFPGDTTTAPVIRTHATDSALEHIDRYSSRATVELEPLTYGTREQFARRLCSVHCVAHPSKGEGFGLVPFQAIGCETPVIAPATTGMAEYINPGTATVLRTGPTIKGQTWQNQPGEYHDVDTAALSKRCWT